MTRSLFETEQRRDHRLNSKFLLLYWACAIVYIHQVSLFFVSERVFVLQRMAWIFVHWRNWIFRGKNALILHYILMFTTIIVILLHHLWINYMISTELLHCYISPTFSYSVNLPAPPWVWPKNHGSNWNAFCLKVKNVWPRIHFAERILVGCFTEIGQIDQIFLKYKDPPVIIRGS